MIIKAAIVEDDPRIRASLRTMLCSDGEIICVADCGSGQEALDTIPAAQPDVVLMDINLPDLSGIECVRRLVAPDSRSSFVMLTNYHDSDAIFASLKAGASGYLLKPVRTAQLLAAVRDVITGGSPLSSSIARRIVSMFRDTSSERLAFDQARPGGLSRREEEILQLLSDGYLYKEISEKLGISYSTVRTHIERIYDKLHVNSRFQAVAKAKALMPQSTTS